MTQAHHPGTGTVRAARLADAVPITEVHIASWQGAYRGLLPDGLLDNLSVDDRLPFWQQLLAEERNPVFVAKQNGQVVGFISCGPSRDEDVDAQQVAEIFAVYLHPDAWGRGHGRRLISAATASLVEAGYQEVALWVLRDNQQARRFYERIGFMADGSHKIETWRNSVEVHEVRYRLGLVRHK